MKILKRIKRFIRMQILGKISVLDVLEYVDTHRRSCLCFSINNACFHFNRHPSNFKDVCSQFKHDVALNFGADHDAYWWPQGEWDTGREEFLHYLIDYYRNQEPIYLKH